MKSRSFEDSELTFTSTVKKQLLTLRNQLNQECGKVKKVRGLAYGFRVSPQMLNRIITSSKGVFLPFLNDVFITNDPVKHSKSKVPGYGIVLYAETTKSIVYAADGFIGKDEMQKMNEAEQLPMLSTRDLDSVETGKKRSFDIFNEEDNPEFDEDEPKNNNKKQRKLEVKDGDGSENPGAHKSGFVSSPEELGVAVAKQLLREISTQSRVDSVFQWLVLGFMTLGPKDVTSVVLGPLTPFTVQFLRDLKTFFGVTFKVEDFKEGVQDEEDDEEEKSNKTKLHKLSCLGTGYINLNKTMV